MRSPARGVVVASLRGALNVECRFQLLYFAEHLCTALRHEFSVATTVSFVVLPFTDSLKSF